MTLRAYSAALVKQVSFDAMFKSVFVFILLENDCDQKKLIFSGKKKNSRFNPIHFPLVYPELLFTRRKHHDNAF